MKLKKVWLATDLDGTLIPLTDHPENQTSLELLTSELVESNLGLVFVTGRHLSSVLDAIGSEKLPTPEWIICDVGSSIYQIQSGEPVFVQEYQAHLDSLKAGWDTDRVEELLKPVDGLRKQEAEKLSANKLSYYADAASVSEKHEEIDRIISEHDVPWTVISSVDPFNGDGLIDLLPNGTNKAAAIEWWCEFEKLKTEDLIFAGDSGNDLAAFQHGYRSIVVGNANRKLANKVFWCHQNFDQGRRLYLSEGFATTGVVEGLRWFGALPLEGQGQQAAVAENSLGWNVLSTQQSTVSVWAPKCRSVSVYWEEANADSNNSSNQTEMSKSADGVFTAAVPAGPDTTYQFFLNQNDLRPDPRSRFQPVDVHGVSRATVPQYAWTDQDWKGLAKNQLVIYELHVGTFTEAGTYDAVIDRLDDLIELGITAIELLPVAQCPGKWNWGYDGVHLFAPSVNYGSPAQLRRLVDTCHQKGLAVILDVVYNHLGPEGNYLSQFGPYFTNRHGTPWGDALNFDGEDRQQVRQLMVDNAVYWLRDFHFDGLRLDAIHFMFDDSDYSITQEICDAVDVVQKDLQREIHLIGEANIFDSQLIDSSRANRYDAIWADCLMHSVYSYGVPEVSLAHRHYTGLGDIAETLVHGFLYTGPKLERQKRLADSQPENGTEHLQSLIMALQTHDSVGNHPHGARLSHLTNVDFQMAAASLFLLYPALPMIFMGEETADPAPFRFFADFLNPALRKAVDRGRRQEYPNHQWKGAIAPSDPDAFATSKLQITADQPSAMRDWYQALLKLRKSGVKECWLDSQKLSVQIHPQSHHFHLTYSDSSGAVEINAQLISPGDEPKFGNEIPALECSGTVVLDSWQFQQERTGSSRCIVVRK